MTEPKAKAALALPKPTVADEERARWIVSNCNTGPDAEITVCHIIRALAAVRAEQREADARIAESIYRDEMGENTAAAIRQVRP
jgi:hypothetical protein